MTAVFSALVSPPANRIASNPIIAISRTVTPRNGRFFFAPVAVHYTRGPTEPFPIGIYQTRRHRLIRARHNG
jgi:hypothetical protein